MSALASRTSFLASTLAILAFGCADSDDEPTLPIGDEEIAELEARADAIVAAGVPGVVAVVREGDQTVRIARGVADRATGAPLTADARFRAASVAKSVLAVVLLQLEAEGALRLDDTIDAWLPGMVRGNGHATLEELIRLESGIPDYAADPRHMAPYYAGDFEHAWTPQQLVALANDQETLFAPGEGWSYSNTNYALLGLVIEKATGQPLADAVQARVFDRLGMTHSRMAVTGAIESPVAHGHMVGIGPAPLDVTGISASSMFGSGNLVATGEDLVAFYGGLAAGDLLGADQLARMTAFDPRMPETRYAMGLWRFDDQYGCGTYYGHDGGAPGYLTTAYTSLDGERQYALFVTAMTVDEKAGDTAAQAAWAELNHAAACR
jgi:D-alanyl-D-alanine carboxypeptidase